jgi:hypothetical protein
MSERLEASAFGRVFPTFLMVCLQCTEHLLTSSKLALKMT